MEVHHLLATAADEMMVRCVRYFKTGLAFCGLNAGNQAMLFKGGQGTVNRVQRNGRQRSQYTCVKDLGRGMISNDQQLAVYFRPLVGNFQSGTTAGGYKLFHDLL